MSILQVIQLVISIAVPIGAVIGHFFVISKKLVKMETRLDFAEKDILDLKKHIPGMEQKINETNKNVAVVLTKIDMLLEARK